MGAFNRLSQQMADGGKNRSGAFSRSWEGPFDIDLTDEANTTSRYARTQNLEKVDDFNAKLLAWQEKVKAALGPSISESGIKGSKLARSIKGTSKEQYGEIYRLGFSFKREGIFVHKGVGRGYVMKGDTVVKISKTEGFNRHPKPWFNPVVESFIPELAEIVHDYYEGAILRTGRIFIK